jgi:hypothetical protein
MTATRRRQRFAVLVIVAGIPIAALAGQQARDAAPRPPTGTAIVAGRVLTADATPVAVRHARVTISNGEYGSGWSATTTDDGSFIVTGLPAGRLTIRASKPAWLPAEYGAMRPGGEGVQVAIADAERRQGLVLTMYPGAVLTGTVRDRTGQPVPGAGVTISRFAYSPQSGEQSLATAASTSTDDLGVYRAFGLTPGEYVVSAALRTGPSTTMVDLQRLTDDEVQRVIADAKSAPTAAAAAPPPAGLVGYAPTYYPGTTSASLAGRVKIGVSEERGGVDIRLDPVPTARVDAVVTLPDGANAASVQVFLVSNQPSRLGAAAMMPGRRDANGRFGFAGLTPDAYTLVARAAPAIADAGSGDPAAGRGRGSVAPLTLHAVADVAIDGRDVIVPLDLKPGVTVSGRLIFAGDANHVPTDVRAVQISLSPIRGGPSLTVEPARLAANGTFQFVGVPAGTYSVSYSSGGVLDGWTLKSAVSRGQDALDAMLVVRLGETVDDLVLTFTDRPAELAGSLQDASGRPAPAYHIVVFAADRAFWTPFSRRVREMRPDTNGAFLFKGLPPGDYLVAALTDVEPGEWRNPSMLADLVAGAARVAIRDGARTTQDLRIR